MHFYYFIVFATAFNKIFRAFKQIITGRLGTDHLTVTRRVSLVEQELIINTDFYWGLYCSIFISCVMFCRSLFILLFFSLLSFCSFLFCSLHCLSISDLRFLNTPLASSNFSYIYFWNQWLSQIYMLVKNRTLTSWNE